MNEDLAEVIFMAVPVRAHVIDILGRLIWMTPDNGGDICKTLQSWLVTGDAERVKVALDFDEVFLWNSESEMESLLDPLAKRLPSVMEDCIAARGRWRMQFPLGDNDALGPLSGERAHKLSSSAVPSAPSGGEIAIKPWWKFW